MKDLRLEVYYQPKINIKTNKIAGFEALARFKSSLGEQLSTENVLEKFFFDFKNFNEEKIPNIAINISSLEIEDIEFIKWINDLSSIKLFQMGKIEFEITENHKVKDEINFLKSINHLKRLGIKTYIDNLGKGFNTFDLIHKYPVDTIKLDKSIIRKNSNNIKNIINEIHSLNFNIVVEGIENESDYRLIKELECEFGQGFYFDKPMPFKNLNL